MSDTMSNNHGYFLKYLQFSAASFIDGTRKCIEYFNISYTSKESQNTVTVCLRVEKNPGDRVVQVPW